MALFLSFATVRKRTSQPRLRWRDVPAMCSRPNFVTTTSLALGKTTFPPLFFHLLLILAVFYISSTINSLKEYESSHKFKIWGQEIELDDSWHPFHLRWWHIPAVIKDEEISFSRLHLAYKKNCLLVQTEAESIWQAGKGEMQNSGHTATYLTEGPNWGMGSWGLSKVL